MSLTATGAQSAEGVSNATMDPTATWIAYVTDGSDLGPPDLNGKDDVYLRNRLTGAIQRVTIGHDGSEADGSSGGPSISADGEVVAFWSAATNLVPDDTNGYPDAFVWYRSTETIERVSVSSSGAQGFFGADDPHVSADGGFVVFESSSWTLVPSDPNVDRKDVFLRDLALGTTEIITLGSGGAGADGPSCYASVSSHGRFVAFTSTATNLMPGPGRLGSEVYVHDRLTGMNRVVSQAFDGGDANGLTTRGSISSDGRSVLFRSSADNIIPNDLNGSVQDVFLWDGGLPGPTTYCVAQENSAGCTPAMSFSGIPSATAGSGFDLEATNVVNQKFGLLFYGRSGSKLSPFLGGWLCVQSPVRRTPIQSSAGSASPVTDCSGSFCFDFNAWIAGGADRSLVPGEEVWAQYWSRDPAAVGSTTNLTDAVAFEIGN